MIQIWRLYLFICTHLIVFTNHSKWQTHPTLSSSYFSHNDPLKRVGLRDGDWPKATQLAYMAKVKLELTVSRFLAWCLNHETVLDGSVGSAELPH